MATYESQYYADGQAIDEALHSADVRSGIAGLTDIGEAIADDDEILLRNVSAVDPAPSIVKASPTRLWTWVLSKLAALGGATIGSYITPPVTGVSGTLTKADHAGRWIVTSGNVTVPNGESDVGFSAVIVAGDDAHTVTFNSTVSAAMAAGDMMTVYVQSTTVIHAVLTASANKVTFT
jgi:hypothetical protein